jgi:hypothetical protein
MKLFKCLSTTQRMLEKLTENLRTSGWHETTLLPVGISWEVILSPVRLGYFSASCHAQFLQKRFITNKTIKVKRFSALTASPHSPGQNEENNDNLGQDNRSPLRQSNTGSQKYEATTTSYIFCRSNILQSLRRENCNTNIYFSMCYILLLYLSMYIISTLMPF